MRALRHKYLRQALLPLLALALLWLTLRTVPLGDVWAVLRRLQPADIALLLAANAVVLAFFSARWWLLLYAQGYALPYHKLMGYRLATFAVSYFTPGPHFGGEPLQVYLVSRRDGVPAPVSLAAVVLDKLLDMLFNFTFVVVGALFVLQWQAGKVEQGGQTGQMQMGAALGFGLLFLLPALILLALAAGRRPLSGALAAFLRLRRRLFPGPAAAERSEPESAAARFVATLQESERLGSRLLRQRPWLMATVVLASLLSWAAMIGEFWLMTYLLGFELSLPAAMVAMLAARAAFLLPLPAAVGALEAGMALALVSLGLPATYGIGLSLLIRARDVGLGLAGLALTGWYLGRPAGQGGSELVSHGQPLAGEDAPGAEGSAPGVQAAVTPAPQNPL